jgi:RNA polymerase sigma-70 factor, ECF subfamily
MSPSSAPASAHAGEEDALERLTAVARSQRGSLAAVARQEGLSAAEAVDCVQDALCTLLDLVQSGQIDAAANPGPVMVTIVRNEARNQRRRHFRARPHVEAEPELVDESLVLQEELLSKAEETVRLRACVAELCEIQRAVVTLRLLEERPGEDVAALLGVSKNHVAVLLYRAKSALRECMIAQGTPS